MFYWVMVLFFFQYFKINLLHRHKLNFLIKSVRHNNQCLCQQISEKEVVLIHGNMHYKVHLNALSGYVGNLVVVCQLNKFKKFLTPTTLIKPREKLAILIK